MCQNAFLPVDVITFWAVQMFSVCLPTVCFMTYMVHKIGAVEDARKIKEKKGTVEIKSDIPVKSLFWTNQSVNWSVNPWTRSQLGK